MNRYLITASVLIAGLLTLAPISYPPPSGGAGVSDGQQIFDDSHILVADFGEHKLFSGTDDVVPGNITVNWGQGQLFTPDGTVILNWDNDNTLNLFAGIASIIRIASPWWPSGVGPSTVFLGGAAGFDVLTNNTGDGGLGISLFDRQLVGANGTTVVLDWSDSTGVRLPTIPTSDPGVVGQLWNDEGTVKISAGPP